MTAGKKEQVLHKYFRPTQYNWKEFFWIIQ
jgi:hypothetical protein